MTSGANPWNWVGLAGQLAISQLGFSPRVILLSMGLGCFATGILLLFHHQREWDASFSKKSDARTRQYEDRKFRRRTVLASMISSAGCMMASTYWLVEPRLWALMMGALLLMLVGIIGLGLLDLFSVGLHEIAEGNPTAHEAMVQKYLELREKRQREAGTGESADDNAPREDQ